MKKILKVLSVGLLSAAVALSASSVAFAAGINESEQKILDELHTTVTMNGVEKSLPVQYINQTENYLNTVDITEEQATKVIAGIEEIKAYLEKTGASSYNTLTNAQIDELVVMSNKVAGVVGLTLAYDKSTRIVSIVGSNNSIPVDNDPIKTTGADFNIPGVTVVAGVGILLVSAAGIYLFKISKKETSSDVKA